MTIEIKLLQNGFGRRALGRENGFGRRALDGPTKKGKGRENGFGRRALDGPTKKGEGRGRSAPPIRLNQTRKGVPPIRLNQTQKGVPPACPTDVYKERANALFACGKKRERGGRRVSVLLTRPSPPLRLARTEDPRAKRLLVTTGTAEETDALPALATASPGELARPVTCSPATWSSGHLVRPAAWFTGQCPARLAQRKIRIGPPPRPTGKERATAIVLARNRRKGEERVRPPVPASCLAVGDECGKGFSSPIRQKKGVCFPLLAYPQETKKKREKRKRRREGKKKRRRTREKGAVPFSSSPSFCHEERKNEKEVFLRGMTVG